MRLQLGQHREVPGGHFTPKLLVEGGQGAGGHLTPGGQWQATVGTGKLSVRGKFCFSYTSSTHLGHKEQCVALSTYPAQ